MSTQAPPTTYKKIVRGTYCYQQNPPQSSKAATLSCGTLCCSSPTISSFSSLSPPHPSLHRKSSLRGLPLVEALRQFLESFRLPGESPIVERILGSFSQHWLVSTLQYTPINTSTLQYTIVYSCLLLYTIVYSSILQCTTIYSSILQCTTIYSSILQCTTIYSSILQCTTIYSSIRESVDSLCRDGADAQYMQYLSKSRITSPQTR